MGNPAAAEDLTQGTFARALTRIDLFREGSFQAWLYAIARNLCLNYLKSKFFVHEIVGIDPSFGSTGEPYSMDSGVLDDVRATLNQLSAPQRICLKLLYIEGYSYKEISAATGYSEKDVKSHVQNGRRRFQILWKRIQERDSE